MFCEAEAPNGTATSFIKTREQFVLNKFVEYGKWLLMVVV